MNVGRVIIVAGLGLGLLACGEQRPSGAGGVQAGADGDTGATTQPPNRKGGAVIDLAPDTVGSVEETEYAGALPQPIEYYSTNPAAFVEFVQSRGWVGNERPRRCSDCPGNAEARLKIQAIEDAYRVGFDDIPPNGVLIARAENVGVETDERSGMGRGEQRYLLLTGPAGQDSARYVTVVVTGTTGNQGVEQRAGGVLEACTGSDGRHPRRRFPYADFRNCNDPLKDDPSQPFVLGAYDKGGWMACVHGCCTSGFPSIE